MNRDFEFLRVEKHSDGTAVIAIDRPEARNAMSIAAQAELRDALDGCRDDTRAIVLTGTGKAFCSGVDLKERRAQTSQRRLAHRGDTWTETNMALYEHPAVCIAAVNGYALGGGLTLVNSCDLALAADEAQLGMPEVTFGAYPAYAGPSSQLRMLPKAAAWLILTAERVGGQRAVELGIVNKAVPLSELMDESLSLAREIAQRDAVTLDWIKKGLHQVPSHIQDYRQALDYGPLVTQSIRSQSATYTGALSEIETQGAQRKGAEK